MPISLTRREFLRIASLGSVGLVLEACAPQLPRALPYSSESFGGSWEQVGSGDGFQVTSSVLIKEWQGKTAFQIYRGESLPKEIVTKGVLLETINKPGAKVVSANIWIAKQEVLSSFQNEDIYAAKLTARIQRDNSFLAAASADFLSSYGFLTQATKIPNQTIEYPTSRISTQEVVQIMPNKWNRLEVRIPEEALINGVSISASSKVPLEVYFADISLS